MSLGQWMTDLGALFPDAAGAPARLDTAVLSRAAGLLGTDPSDLVVTARCLIQPHGGELPALEIRTNTWRVDVPTAIVKSVLTGTVTATILRPLGADTVPAAVLRVVAPLVFEIRRVEGQPSDAVIQARLVAAAGGGPRRLNDLYDVLPDGVCAELSLAEFVGVVERLLLAGLAVAGADGLRVRAPGARGGFRLVVSGPLLLPGLSSPGPLDGGDPPESAGKPHTTERLGLAFWSAPDGRPRVFVSYAHDSEAHKERVLDFCEFLVASGIDAKVDQWDLDERRDWQQWATAQIRDADFVIVVASPACKQVGNGTGTPDGNLGMQSELRQLRELYHTDPATWTRRILPVVLPGGSVDDIPLFLQPNTADHFRVTSFSEAGAEDLLRVVTRQPPFIRPSPGPLPVLPPRRACPRWAEWC